MSVDGRIDGTGPARLVLSGGADLDRVDAERAASDAIMVGAGTIRRDDPRLLIRSAEYRAARAARDQPEHPAGVTITASGDLDPAARFFDPGRGSGAAEDGTAGDGTAGDGTAPPERLVYCASPAVTAVRGRLGGRAEIIDAGAPVRLEAVLADLGRRGVRRLMVEGGAGLGTEFLAGGLVDELQLVIAPFFVGDPAAPRFAGPGRYPHGPDHRMTLAEVRPVGEVALLRYLLTDAAGLDGLQDRASEAADG
jgi:5-amino-6-(5-phosphoribosylamino)uracil reductase